MRTRIGERASSPAVGGPPVRQRMSDRAGDPIAAGREARSPNSAIIACVEWVHSANDILEVFLRLVAAAAVGSAIGIDRELRGKPAGLRTHAMVALGAALIMIVTGRMVPTAFEHVDAMSRAIQGIIAGVGFLGAGAILKGGGEETTVHGLTTAASIWVVASLGIACGAGQWIASLIAGALTLLILIVGVPVEAFIRRIFGRQPD